MTDRLNKIFEVIPSCECFADVGCDHGYIAKAMLSTEKCKRVIISDISAKCLSKAEKLLADYIREGRAISVVSNGFEKVFNVDVALIAGMGGMEIISILKRAKTLPKTLVLQPMKNCPEVRREAINLGYKFLLDKVFFSSKKFYDVMVITKGDDNLSQEEIEFGKTNVAEKGEDFSLYVKAQIKKLTTILKSNSISEDVKNELLKKLERLKKYD